MKFSFVKNRYTFYTIALVLMITSVLSPLFVRLNMWIDMTWGIQIEYSVESGNTDEIIDKVRSEIIDKVRISLDEKSQDIITDTLIYRVTWTEKFIIEAGVNENGATLEEVEAAKTLFTQNTTDQLTAYNNGITQSKYINIWASFGDYIKKSGFLTLGIAIIAISIYIMYAFSGSIAGMSSWPFALVTWLSLLHDIIVAFGLYVLTSFFFPEFKIDTFFLTAMLTILGYSINDTIVVMDRIRSNLDWSDSKKIALSKVIDQSIYDTMNRSIFTSLTVIIVLVAMFIWGPDSLRGFTLALIFGGIVGTYSSVCLASPLLIDLTGKK